MMKRNFKIFTTLLCSFSLFLAPIVSAKPLETPPGHAKDQGKSEKKAHRYHGEDRFKTSSAIADELGNSAKVDNIILVSGHNFPDALSANALAYRLKAPIILAGKELNDSHEVFNYAKEHVNPGGTIYIIGGHGVISSAVEKWLVSYGINVVRLGGKDRYETNSLLVTNLSVPVGTPVIIASAHDYPDALGISSLSASKGWPILLSGPSKLPDAVQTFLKSDLPGTVYLIGGEGVLNQPIAEQIKALSPNSTIERLGGGDRFETLSAILSKFYPAPDKIYLANGYEFADALSGSTIAAEDNAPILLINPGSKDLPRGIEEYLKALGNKGILPIVDVLGGEGAVPQRLVDQVNEALKITDSTDQANYVRLIVKNSSTLGVNVLLSPALAGLTAADFSLVDSNNNPVTVTSATTSDNGKTYALATALTSGAEYRLTAAKTGYNFGSAKSFSLNSSTPSIFTAATLNNTQIQLTMNSNLIGSAADRSAFKVTGVASNPMVTAVSVSGNKVDLTLSHEITEGDTAVTVSYTRTGNYDLTSGVLVANFSHLAVNNLLTALTPVVTGAATLNNYQIVLNLNKALTGSVGNPAAFSISGVASEPIITTVIVNGTTVKLGLSREITAADTGIKINYARTGAFDLTNGVLVGNFNALAVTNTLLNNL